MSCCIVHPEENICHRFLFPKCVAFFGVEGDQVEVVDEGMQWWLRQFVQSLCSGMMYWGARLVAVIP